MKICEECLEPFWTDTSLASHIKNEHHTTTCWGCEQVLTFQNIPSHGRCCKVDLECTSCGEVGRGKDILKHIDKHKEAISCPLGCGKRFFSGRLYRRRVKKLVIAAVPYSDEFVIRKVICPVRSSKKKYSMYFQVSNVTSI